MSPCPCLNGGLLALAPLVPWANVLIKEGQLRLDTMEILDFKHGSLDQNYLQAETKAKTKEPNLTKCQIYQLRPRPRTHLLLLLLLCAILTFSPLSLCPNRLKK